ncbi:MAG TPA: ABC transporter permease [Terriglobales bacterium]|nr:ABC transporter permease [Terriglobales bacterium]
MRDLRHAFRLMLRSPGLSMIAVLSLALGIGANTTIFSFADALLFQRPPVASPGRLAEVYVHDTAPDAPVNGYLPFSYPDYLDYIARQHSLAGMALYTPATQATVAVNSNAEPQSWTGQLVSANYFSVLGIAPALGRWFTPQEGAVTGSGAVVVLSYAGWQRFFGAEPGVIGRQINFNQIPFTVIGVAPRGFVGVFNGVECDFWSPITMAARLGQPGLLTSRDSHGMFAFGRLRPGASRSAATADLTLVQQGLNRQYPNQEIRGVTAIATPMGMVPTPLRSFVSGGALLLAVVVGLVLLIACANAALVMLVQSLGRRREWAVRSALGASRGRLVRQSLVHSVLLALLAGALGIALSQWLGPVLLRLRPPGFPIALTLGLDGHILWFTLALALVTGVLFGLAPAWQGARVNVLSNLKDGTPGAGAARSRARSAFIIGQVALCVVVLIGSALCLRSLGHARAVDPGFDTQHLLLTRINPLSLGYQGDAAHQFLQRVAEAVRRQPGVLAAAYVAQPPLQLSDSETLVLPPGMAPPPHHRGFDVDFADVSPGYFAAAGTPLLAGRDFTRTDLAHGHAPAVVVNETLARQLWPRTGAIGQTLAFPGSNNPPATVVGVAENGKYRSLGEPPRPYLYQLQALHAGTLVVKVAGSPRAFLPALRRAILRLDPDLPGAGVETVQQFMAVPLFPARFTGILLGGFGVLALLLAVVGLYGVIAASVAQRTREYGIRMALGANAPALLRLVVGQGLRLALWGVGLGVVLAALLTQFMAALLYGMSPLDPLSYLAAAAVLLAVAALASYVPALRATRVDPLQALRWE